MGSGRPGAPESGRTAHQDAIWTEFLNLRTSAPNFNSAHAPPSTAKELHFLLLFCSLDSYRPSLIYFRKGKRRREEKKGKGGEREREKTNELSTFTLTRFAVTPRRKRRETFSFFLSSHPFPSLFFQRVPLTPPPPLLLFLPNIMQGRAKGSSRK